MYSRLQRGRLSLAMLCFSTLSLAGCGGGGSAPRGDLTGAVTDYDGRSVAGASVTSGFHSATSLSNGTFVLTGLKEGYQTVVASANVKGHSWSGMTTVDLVGDEQNRSTNIVISDDRYHATLGGTIIDPNGFVLEGAKVFIQGPYGSTLAVTDRNGYYEADRLAPNAGPTETYTVTASLAGYKNDTRTIHLDKNQDASLSFALSAGSSNTLPAPTGLTAQAWTIADTVNRSAKTGSKGDVYDWLRHVYRKKRGLPDAPQAKTIDRKPGKPSGRATPVGSVVEIDLFWTYAADPQLFGYAIKRALSQSALPSADVTAILRDPLASAFFDVDPVLTPDQPYYYTVHALDTISFPDQGTIGPPSAPASANPLLPIRGTSPTQGQSVSGTPTFTWTPVNGAAAYQIYVWDEFPTLMFDPNRPNDPNATQPIWPTDPSNPGNALVLAPATSLTYQGPALAAGHTYYWLVVALDSAGTDVGAISASQIAKFTKR